MSTRALFLTNTRRKLITGRKYDSYVITVTTGQTYVNSVYTFFRTTYKVCFYWLIFCDQNMRESRDVSINSFRPQRDKITEKAAFNLRQKPRKNIRRSSNCAGFWTASTGSCDIIRMMHDDVIDWGQRSRMDDVSIRRIKVISNET